MTAGERSAWDDADRAVQIEDDNPESLAGEEVDAVDLYDRIAVTPEDFPPTAASSAAIAENPPVEGA